MSENKPHYASLPGILKEFGNSRRIIAGVILTYEFDPLLALSLARTELLQFDADPGEGCLRFKGAFPACLFHDPKRSRNEVTFPGDFEIHYKAKTGVACHHSKSYAFAHSDGTFTLVLGSLNLTEPGLLTNRETLLLFTLDDDSETSVRKLFGQWRDFLEQNYRSNTPSAGLANYLDLLNRKLQATRPTTSDSDVDNPLQLITSGYDSPSPSGLEQLKNFCQKQALEPTRLLVVSPFFDHDPKRKNLLKDFKETFPYLEAVSMFSTFDDWGATFFEPFRKEGLGPCENSRIRCFQIPKTISEDEAECIDCFHSGERTSIKNKRELTRELHAKIVLLCDESGKSVLYIGSANFSSKAWLGENFELGVAGVLPKGSLPTNWDQKFVKKLLNVETEKLKLKPDDVKLSADPTEEESTDPTPPVWLESILLMHSASGEPSPNEISGRFRFYVRKGEKLPELGDFTFEFGSTPILLVWPENNSGDYFVSDKTIHFQKPQLESCRVIKVTKLRGDRTGSCYIPFNIDYEFGLQTEYRLLIQPENGLQFLTQLCIPSVNETQAKKFADSDKEVLERLYERYEHQTDNDKRNSKTHVMRTWISALGQLEKALIEPGTEENTDKLKITSLRSDFFTMLLAHANALRAQTKFGGEDLNGSDKAFMLMELAILASRVASLIAKDQTGGNQSNVNSSAPDLTKIKQCVYELKEVALRHEMEHPPVFSEKGNPAESDPYSDLLQKQYEQFNSYSQGKWHP